MKEYKSATETELLNLLIKSDHKAYTEIYERYFDLVYIHAYKKLQNDDQTKDVVQDIFTNLWIRRENASNIKGLAAYLFTAARYTILDIFAHQGVKDKHLESLQDYLSANPVLPTDYQIRENEFRAYIDQQIATLPPKMRLIFRMNRIQQMSYNDIAEELSTSENNISKQVNSALKILRAKLASFLMLLF